MSTQTIIDEKPVNTGSVSPLGQEHPSKSPLSTARRLSQSSMDDVELENNTSPARSRSATITSNDNINAAPTQAPKPPPRPQGLSGSLPSIPWGPPPAPPKIQPQAPVAPPRKLGGPFSWLSRNTSAKTDISTAPPIQTSAPVDRRNTAPTLAISKPELMLSRLDEGDESDSSNATSQKPARNSLKDRFKMLRMREEVGINSLEASENGSPTRGGVFAGLVGRSASVGLGIGSPTSIADEKEGGLSGSPIQSPVSAGPPTTMLTSPVNPALAPGTASGVSAGPSAMTDSQAPVDWDLWQSVVYEGPAAVARTSAEELNKAIAGGIPSAIRGVVWQVLAHSKNEELEGMYRDLVSRGTEKDRDLKDIASTSNHNLVTENSKEKVSVTSSASSIHSNHSTPATNGMTSPSPSQQEKESEGVAKLQSAMQAERKRKSKEDAAALQKLEKTIKRDLGARTSFSKYTAAAGLQDGLFGVCKAYALFDEGVGYAQGMNFLAMPLLFNVEALLRLLWICADYRRCRKKKLFVCLFV